jgi:hypothetical protein
MTGAQRADYMERLTQEQIRNLVLRALLHVDAMEANDPIKAKKRGGQRHARIMTGYRMKGC